MWSITHLIVIIFNLMADTLTFAIILLWAFLYWFLKHAHFFQLPCIFVLFLLLICVFLGVKYKTWASKSRCNWVWPRLHMGLTLINMCVSNIGGWFFSRDHHDQTTQMCRPWIHNSTTYIITFMILLKIAYSFVFLCN